MAKVFIGVGHGGADPGAIANGLYEANINLQMALEMSRQLVRHGVNVLLSRTRDENDSLAEEIKEANAFQPDLAIDVHNNAGGGDGWEALVQTNTYKTAANKLAKLIETEVVKIGQNSRGLKTRLNAAGADWYGFLRQIAAPAILVEGAFLDNTNDLQRIDELDEQKAFGAAYAKGVLAYLGIAWKEESPTFGTLCRVQVGAFSARANAESCLDKVKAAGFTDAFIIEV